MATTPGAGIIAAIRPTRPPRGTGCDQLSDVRVSRRRVALQEGERLGDRPARAPRAIPRCHTA